MRTKFIFAVITALFATSGLFAQMHDHSKTAGKEITDTIHVAGKCGMCKSRIEAAAKIHGVYKATWNSEQQNLILVYNPSETKNEDVQKKIAAVGHDTEKYRADDKVYNSLPGCCRYERTNN